MPKVIGIAGGSGSGKTTFTNLIKESACDKKVEILSTDNYFKVNKAQVKAPYSDNTYIDYDDPNSLDLKRFLEDIHTILQDEIDILLIEGLYVLYFEEIRRLLDLKLFVDCSSDERLVRRLKRDLSEESFEKITMEYIDLVRHRYNQYIEPTRWFADLIVNGSTLSPKSLEVLNEWMQKT